MSTGTETPSDFVHKLLQPIQCPKTHTCKHPQVVATISPEDIHHFARAHLRNTISFGHLKAFIFLHLIHGRFGRKNMVQVPKSLKKFVSTKKNHHFCQYHLLKNYGCLKDHYSS